MLGVGEFGLLCNGINADADPVGAHGGEFSGQVAEVAGLLGAAGRHRGRVEEQHHGSIGQQRTELARGAGLVGKLEVGHGVTGFHGRYATPGINAASEKTAWKIEACTPNSPSPPPRGTISTRSRPNIAWGPRRAKFSPMPRRRCPRTASWPATGRVPFCWSRPRTAGPGRGGHSSAPVR